MSYRPERRSCERFPVPGGTVDWAPASDPGDVSTECAIGDLSRGGVRLLTTGPAAKGTHVNVTLLVPGEPDALRLKGTVVWAQVSSGQLQNMAVAFAPYTEDPGDNPPAALERLVAIEGRYVAPRDKEKS
ncbi:MAG TPA: PilZ domain-containing protein [Vicinamibacteria bacterium]